MTPAARLQAAGEILDEVIASARADGPPADTIVTRYFKQRRYAGSERPPRGARAGVPGHSAIRGNAGERAGGDPWIDPGRAGLGRAAGPAARAGARRSTARRPRSRESCRLGLSPNYRRLLARSEWPALLERAPLDLRVNAARAARDDVLGEFPEATPTPLSPWGIRLPPDSKVDDQPAYLDGRVEIQDEGSQLIALACEPGDGERLLDLCAGGGGKTLRLSAAAPGATILATDSNRMRLSKLQPRAERAGATIETPAPQPAATSSRSSTTGAARPTSCWSMRLARAAAPGGATPKAGGG